MGHIGPKGWFLAEMDNNCIIKNKCLNFLGSCNTVKIDNSLKILIFKIQFRNADICEHSGYVLESCAFSV